jgi:hypothetical protein
MFYESGRILRNYYHVIKCSGLYVGSEEILGAVDVEYKTEYSKTF